MIALLLWGSLLYAQQDSIERFELDDCKELVTCRFLDEFFDYKITNTDDLDTLYLSGPELVFEEDERYDLTSTE